LKKEKTKFILFGQSRSGSTLLKSLLDSHQDIICDGELFNPDEGYVTNKWALKFFRRFPDLLINYRVIRSLSKVYGYTLFHFQIRNIEFFMNQSVDKGWKIVHITRNNIFQQSLSNVIAKKTGFWHRQKENKTPDYTINLPPEELANELEKRITWHRFEEEILKNLEHIKVVYENDLADSRRWDSSMKRVLEYINAEPYPLNTNLLKTDPRPYDEIIENYKEILDYLKKTPLNHLIPKK